MKLELNALNNIEKITINVKEFTKAFRNVDLVFDCFQCVHMSILTKDIATTMSNIEKYFMKNIDTQPVIHLNVSTFKGALGIESTMRDVLALMHRYGVTKYSNLPTGLVIPRFYTVDMAALHEIKSDNKRSLMLESLYASAKLARAAGVHIIFLDHPEGSNIPVNLTALCTYEVAVNKKEYRRWR